EGIVLPLATASVTALTDGVQALALTYESPSYGGVAVIKNVGRDDCYVVVLSSNRSVYTPRILNDLVTPQQFSNNGQPFVAATPMLLLGGGGFTWGYVANYDASFTVDSTDAGTLDFQFVDIIGTIFTVPLGEVAVGLSTLPVV